MPPTPRHCRRCRPPPRYWLGIVAGLFPLTDAVAGRLSIEALDRDARPVADVVVYAVPADRTAAAEEPAEKRVMDQIDQQFRPHILVTRVGASVEFPNSDSVSHHVYSFSDAKSFELALYRGTAHPPVDFDTPGVIVLGCNIHDSMLGYIVVVDTPYYAKTGEDGHVSFADLPAGRYTVRAWTPRLRPAALPDPIDTLVPQQPAPSAGTVTFRFTDRLYPPHDASDGSLSWSGY